MKRIIYSRDAARDLRRHRNMAARITKVLDAYAADPMARANNVTQLVGSIAKRIRVGDFRVIFEEGETTLTITKVAPRGDVYE